MIDGNPRAKSHVCNQEAVSLSLNAANVQCRVSLFSEGVLLKFLEGAGVVYVCVGGGGGGGRVKEA